MQTLANAQPRKRPVNLTLTEDLVAQARQLTPNLSGVVEMLLTEFVAQEQKRRREHAQKVAATVAAWNAFGEQHGEFSDEYSTL